MLIRRKVEIGTLEFIFEEILIVKMVMVRVATTTMEERLNLLNISKRRKIERNSSLFKLCFP